MTDHLHRACLPLRRSEASDPGDDNPDTAIVGASEMHYVGDFLVTNSMRLLCH